MDFNNEQEALLFLSERGIYPSTFRVFLFEKGTPFLHTECSALRYLVDEWGYFWEEY